MTRRTLRIALGVLVVAGAAGGGLWWWQSRHQTASTVPTPAPAQVARVIPAARISATVYAVAPEGDWLVPTHRDVPLAADATAQGREIVRAALESAAPPNLSPVPPGVTLRGFFLTATGDAFVDLGGDTLASYRAGATAERLFIYAIVHAVTASLPTAHRVQILVNGTEVDTLGGHVDLRDPLTPDASLLAPPASAATPDIAAAPSGLH